MTPVFDKKSKHVHDFDLDTLGHANNADEAKALVHDAMRHSGTKPKPKKMVYEQHKSGQSGFFIHPGEKAWYE